MKNQIKDTDVLAFVDAAREELGLYMLSIHSIGTSETHFSAVPEMFDTSIYVPTIEELKQKLVENTPEARKRKELEEAKAKVAELEKELGGES